MRASHGRYLDVDLGSGTIKDYEIPESWQRLHLGGRGIGARILLDELSGGEGALSPENILVFSTGPLQGTGFPGAGRHVVMAVSPKTGSVADSYVGGHLGHHLSRSGYDGILLRGRAAHPAYLALTDGKASLRPASDLWGKGTAQTDRILTERHPNAHVASIGIAGENLVQMACIVHDRTRSAGRPGLGAVMGSKQLKAVVVRGTTEKTLADKDRFARERAAYARWLVEDEGMKRFGEYGTARSVAWYSEMGMLPTRNFQDGVFDHAEEISGEKLHDTILVGRDTCTGCPVRCKRRVKTQFRGQEVLPEFGGPEYESVTALGALCLNSDLSSVALANQLCNDYGLDTISTGVAIAFLMEAVERGLVDAPVAWGDAQAVVDLVHRIAHRDGIGDELAQGTHVYAEQLGADFAMTIKGVELPMHEPRGKQGFGISYATSPRGATHMEGIHDTVLGGDHPTPELGVDRPYDRFTLADKPSVMKTYEDLRSFVNSLVLCAFTVNEVGEHYSFPAIRSLVEAATGLAIGVDEMLAVGERNYALLRMHAARCGYTTDDDGLPARFAQGLPRGASAGHPIDPEAMRSAIAAYYTARGYDRLGPTDETLRRLGMEELVGRIPR